MCMIKKQRAVANMVTIKQIAQETGYSISTISIVLRGMAVERKIPESTQKIVLDAARRLGYQPNVSARRLRSRQAAKKNIAVYWATNFETALVANLLRGLQRYVLEQKWYAEVVVCPYKPGHLEESANQRSLNMYSGMILCTASKPDLEYMEQLDTSCPVVLYNRVSQRYPSVRVDNVEVGRYAARKFLQNGCSRFIAVDDVRLVEYALERIAGFEEVLLAAGVTPQRLRLPENSIAAGRNGALQLELDESLHTGIFVNTDNIAFGMHAGLNERGFRMPDTVELLSVGTHEKDLYHCLTPSLSVVEIPIEEIAYRCARLMDDLLENRLSGPVQTMVPFAPHERGTTAGV